MTSAGTLLRTVVHLRAPQLLGRARLLLPRPSPELHPPPALRPVGGTWQTPARRQPSMLGPTSLRFLGLTRSLDEDGWDSPAVALLWRYNLHYFDDLNAIDAGQRHAWHVALVERWIAQNPPASGTGWAPYPTSLRVVNWIKWFCSIPRDRIPTEWLQSLAVQARWLMKRLEWHLLGNHLFANAKALVYAGLYFQGDEASRWLDTGSRILLRELPEQILADGAQFERSPMYHALALEDVLDLVNLCRRHPLESVASLRTALSERVPLMLDWLSCMQHTNGALARFNDCSEGIAPSTAELQAYAAAMGLPDPPPLLQEGARLLVPSGYARMRRGEALLLADVAPIGPDYLPGHAHADTLSYELSVNGRQLVVNRGTSEYGTGPRRQVERGTAAHSTVEVGGISSSEMWAGFRVGRRARIRDLNLQGFELTASHDGYRFMPGAPVHERRWHLEDRSLLVEDCVDPACGGIARHHLAPGLTLKADGVTAWAVVQDEQQVARVEILAGGAARAESWRHALAFGEMTDATTLAIELHDGRTSLRWHW